MFRLIRSCGSLVRVGNLNHWQLANKEETVRMLKNEGWTTAPIRGCFEM